jgi:hypothetical protein
LLLLKQSINEYGIDNTTLIPKGKLLDLGNYNEMVFGHINSKKIEISNGFDLSEGPTYILNQWRGIVKNAIYESIFSCDELRYIKLECIKLYYNNINEPFITIKKSNTTKTFMRRQVMSITRNIKRPAQDSFEVESINCKHPVLKEMYDKYIIEKPKNRKLLSELSPYSYDEFVTIIDEKMKTLIFNVDGFLIIGYGFKSREQDTPQDLHKNFVMELINVDDLIMLTVINYKRLLDSINYLGPLREYPERHYIYSGVSPLSVGKSGKYTSDLLFLNENLTKKVNDWLKIFQIDYEMIINKLKDTEISDVYSMRLIDKKNNVSVSPLDVGFGISQILPIIVQSLISKNSIICIEQPEIHIHPRLQTIFGSFIADCIKAKNQFIIETHSEHIMLRIQKLIAKGIITKDDVSVIYVNRKDNGSKCIELRLDSEGDFLDEWPDGFFEDGYKEVFY